MPQPRKGPTPCPLSLSKAFQEESVLKGKRGKAHSKRCTGIPTVSTADEVAFDEDIRHGRLAGDHRQGDLHHVSVVCMELDG
jgi:hypothetical protein